MSASRLFVALLFVVVSCRHVVHSSVPTGTGGSDPFFNNPLNNVLTRIPIGGNTGGPYYSNNGGVNPQSQAELNRRLSSLFGSGASSTGSSTISNPWSGSSSIYSGNNLGGSTSSLGGATRTSLSGITCSNGQVNPSSVGAATYGGPTKLTCTLPNGQFYSDVCTSLQQCAGLMCAKYVKCPGRLSMSAP